MDRKKANVTNRAMVEELITTAQGKATARTINYAMVVDQIESIEERLTDILYKKDWAGLTILVDPNAQSFPGAYKYTPESTHIIYIRISTGWQVSVYRGICKATKYHIDLSKKADALVEFISKNF